MVFFHYCVVSNYFWLFIEGLYLFTLLVETFFPERRYFYWYTIIGWGRFLAGSVWMGSGLLVSCTFGSRFTKHQVTEPSPHKKDVDFLFILRTIFYFTSFPWGPHFLRESYTQESSWEIKGPEAGGDGRKAGDEV